MNWKSPIKSFIQGSPYSLLLEFLVMPWVFNNYIVLLPTTFEWFFLLILVVATIIGFVNMELTRLIWFQQLQSEVKRTHLRREIKALSFRNMPRKLISAIWYIIWNYGLHGFTLGFLLVFINSFIIWIPNYYYPQTETVVITFIIAAFVYGYIAKNVGSWIKGKEED